MVSEYFRPNTCGGVTICWGKPNLLEKLQGLWNQRALRVYVNWRLSAGCQVLVILSYANTPVSTWIATAALHPHMIYRWPFKLVLKHQAGTYVGDMTIDAVVCRHSCFHWLKYIKSLLGIHAASGSHPAIWCEMGGSRVATHVACVLLLEQSVTYHVWFKRYAGLVNKRVPPWTWHSSTVVLVGRTWHWNETYTRIRGRLCRSPACLWTSLR